MPDMRICETVATQTTITLEIYNTVYELCNNMLSCTVMCLRYRVREILLLNCQSSICVSVCVCVCQ